MPCTTINLELWLRPRLKIIRWVFAIARHACVWTLALEDNHHRGPGVRGGQTKVRSIDRTTYNWRAILIIMMLLGRQLPSPVGMFHAKGLDIDIFHIIIDPYSYVLVHVYMHARVSNYGPLSHNTMPLFIFIH